MIWDSLKRLFAYAAANPSFWYSYDAASNEIATRNFLNGVTQKSIAPRANKLAANIVHPL
jgi:hypothetical protein